MEAKEERQTRAQRRLLDALRKRGLVHGELSRWGQPAIRRIECGHEPERTMDATPLQRRLVACAHGTPSPGHDLCASWVEQSFSRLGLGVVLGNARELYDWYCIHTDTGLLKVGMIVAVGAHPYTASGPHLGHVGLYIGDNGVMDCASDTLRTVPLELWLSAYGLMCEPRWGWLGSIGLG